MTFGGTILGDTNNTYIKCKIDWYYKTNTESNTTTVEARLYYRRTNTGYITGGTGSFSIKINGTVINKTGVSLEISTDWVLAMTGSVNVQHNADGTKSVHIQASGSLPPSTLNETYLADTVALPTIQRASSISCIGVNIGSNPIITISRASSSFTHTITYSFGTLSGTIAEKTTDTSITNWTIPESFYSQIPNSKQGAGVLYCTTYSGNTKIGEVTNCPLAVYTDEAKCKPMVLGYVVDTNDKTIAVTGDPGVLVRYCSTALCEIIVFLQKDAGSILLQTVNNISVPVTDYSVKIPNVETGVFDFYAKDSRGYFNSDKVAKNLVPYIKLTNDATIYRDDPTSGDATLAIEGNYFNGNFGLVDNTLTVKYRREGDDDYTIVTPTIEGNKYSATVSLTGLEYTEAFNYEVVVEDKLNTITKPLTLQKGIPVFDWGEDDFNFNVPVTINGVNILEKLAELEQLVKG